MKILTMVLAILIGGSCVLIYTFYAKKSEPVSLTQTTQPLAVNQAPLEVVKMYVDFSVAGDFDSIRKYTTGYPQEFYDSKDQEVNLYREFKGEIIKKEPVIPIRK